MGKMNNISNIVGLNIAKYRVKMGLTQSGLGELCGVEYGTVQRWEKGKTWPKPDAVELIARNLKISISDIYRGDEGVSSVSAVSILEVAARNIPVMELMAQLPENHTAFELCKDILRGAIEEVSDSKNKREA